MCDAIYVLKGDSKSGAATLLQAVMDAAVQRGLDLEAFYCPMAPAQRLEHIYIPALSLGFITCNVVHSWNGKVSQSINFDTFLKEGFFTADQAFSQEMLQRLLEQACQSLAQAKSTHSALEQYYIQAMDFSALHVLREELLKDILR